MKGNTQLRQDNIRRLLSEIRDHAPITKRKLQRITGFSWGNISFITNKLLNDRYIVSSGKQDTGVGRKPDEYDVNTDDNLFIGIDCSNDGLKLVVTDMRGRAVFQKQTGYPSLQRDAVLNTFYDLIQQTLDAFPAASFRYIAVGMQGLVDTEAGVSRLIGRFEGWQDVPLKAILEERFSLPVMLIHDPDCLMRTEMSYGVLRSANAGTALLVRMERNGVGMSIMMNNRLCTGVHGCAGEIGRMIIPYDGPSGFTYLDWLMPEEGLKSLYAEVCGEERPINYEQLAELARNNDPVGLQIFHKLTVGIGMALINLVNLFNPEYVILYGELQQYADLYMETLTALLRENAYDSSVKLCMSDTGPDSAAIGAALWAADRVMEELQFMEV